MSATGQNRLVQTVPAINTFFSATNTPLSAFEAFAYVDMTLEI